MNDKNEIREQAKDLLIKYKLAEQKLKFHKLKLNEKTTVYCKNEKDLLKYKLKEKEDKVCLSD